MNKILKTIIGGSVFSTFNITFLGVFYLVVKSLYVTNNHILSKFSVICWMSFFIITSLAITFKIVDVKENEKQ